MQHYMSHCYRLVTVLSLNVVSLSHARAVTSFLWTGSKGPLNWENYRYFGKLRKIEHLFNVRGTKLRFSFKFTAILLIQCSLS